MQTEMLGRVIAPLSRAANLAMRIPLALYWAARDRRAYDAMSDAELAVHDLDRDGIAFRLRRRYGVFALT